MNNLKLFILLGCLSGMSVLIGRQFGRSGGCDDEEEGSGGMIGALTLSIIAPLAAMLIQMSISRSREYLADERGARLGSEAGRLEVI